MATPEATTTHTYDLVGGFNRPSEKNLLVKLDHETPTVAKNYF